MTQPLYSSQGVGGQPIVIDAEENIWDPEALLIKWKGGRKKLYLMKQKGFPDKENIFEPPENIDFEATWQGNLGVRLLKKRVRKGKIEYLVEQKGRPKNDNSWEKEATISRVRIDEFESELKKGAIALQYSQFASLFSM